MKYRYKCFASHEITQGIRFEHQAVCISNFSTKCANYNEHDKCIKFKRFTQLWLIVARNCDKIVDLNNLFISLVGGDWRKKIYTKINLPHCYGLFFSRFSFLLREKFRCVLAIQILLNKWNFQCMLCYNFRNHSIDTNFNIIISFVLTYTLYALHVFASMFEHNINSIWCQSVQTYHFQIWNNHMTSFMICVPFLSSRIFFLSISSIHIEWYDFMFGLVV